MPLSDWRDGCEHVDAQALRRRSTTATTCRRTSPAARASTGSMPATPIARRRSGRRSPTARPASRGCSATRTCAPGGRTRTSTARAASRAARRRPGSPQSKPIWFTELGCPAVDRGTNQPNVFFDPKSSESFVPYFSRGWRDDAIQRAYLEATYLWWGDAGEQPDLVGLRRPDGARRRMRRLDLGRAALSVLPRARRRLDRRAELAARALADRAARRGVARRARARTSACAPGMPEDRIDVSGLWGAVEGYVITALESPRASITTLVAALRLRRGRERGRDPLRDARPGPVATLAPDDLVAARRRERRGPGADPRAGDRAAAGAEVAAGARRRGVRRRRSSRRGASPSTRRGSPPRPSRWPCRPRRPSAAAAAR